MSWFVYISAIILVVVGLLIMVVGIEEIRLAKNSTNWSSTEGYITKSTIRENQDSDGDTTYKSVIEFSYEVRRRKLSANRVFFGALGIFTGNRNYYQRVAQKYYKGKTVKVFYNPHQPQQAVLEPGISKKSFILLIYGFLFFDTGSCLALLYWLHQ